MTVFGGQLRELCLPTRYSACISGKLSSDLSAGLLQGDAVTELSPLTEMEITESKVIKARW